MALRAIDAATPAARETLQLSRCIKNNGSLRTKTPLTGTGEGGGVHLLTAVITISLAKKKKNKNKIN